MKIFKISQLISLVFLIAASMVMAQDGDTIVPTMINYQGFLTDVNGTALTGSYQITFRLYDEASGSHPWLWHETHASLTVENGMFNVLLGSIDTLTAEDLSGERYLELKFENEVEMIPRMRLASVAYSLRAEEANNSNALDNKSSEAFVAVDGDTMTGALVLTGSDSLNPTLITNGALAAMNSGFRILSKTGNAWVYRSVSNEQRFFPYWNSWNGSESNTGTLELGYLVLNKKLHFGMLGGYDPELRVEIVDATSGEIYYVVRMTQTLNYFESKEISTEERAGSVVLIRAIDKDAVGSYSWIAISDFFVE